MEIFADGGPAVSGDGPVEGRVRARRVLLVEDDASMRLVCSVNLRLADALSASGFVGKPFDPVALVQLLEGVIEKANASHLALFVGSNRVLAD